MRRLKVVFKSEHLCTFVLSLFYKAFTNVFEKLKIKLKSYLSLPTNCQTKNKQTLRGVQQRKFATIDELVEANEDAYGLVCGLTNPVSNDIPPPIPPFIKGE